MNFISEIQNKQNLDQDRIILNIRIGIYQIECTYIIHCNLYNSSLSLLILL